MGYDVGAKADEPEIELQDFNTPGDFEAQDEENKLCSCLICCAKLFGLVCLLLGVAYAGVVQVGYHEVGEYGDEKVMLSPFNATEGSYHREGGSSHEYSNIFTPCVYPVLSDRDDTDVALTRCHLLSGLGRGYCPQSYRCPTKEEMTLQLAGKVDYNSGTVCYSTTVVCKEPRQCVKMMVGISSHNELFSEENTLAGLQFPIDTSGMSIFSWIEYAIMFMLIGLIGWIAGVGPSLSQDKAKSFAVLVSFFAGVAYAVNTFIFPVYVLNPGIDTQGRISDYECMDDEGLDFLNPLLVWSYLLFIPPMFLSFAVGLGVCAAFLARADYSREE